MTKFCFQNERKIIDWFRSTFKKCVAQFLETRSVSRKENFGQLTQRTNKILIKNAPRISIRVLAENCIVIYNKKKMFAHFSLLKIIYFLLLCISLTCGQKLLPTYSPLQLKYCQLSHLETLIDFE